MSRLSSYLACLPVLALFAARPVQAADAPPPADPGYHYVAVKVAGKTANILVKDQVDPFHAVKDQGGSSPDHFSFSQTSPMANQSYNLADTAASHDNGTYQKSVEHTFITKSYFDHPGDGTLKSAPGLQTVVPVTSAEGYSTTASDYNETFATSAAVMDQSKTADGAHTASTYQGQTAVLGDHETKTFASPMASKTFQGREADAVKNDLSQMNEGLLGMKDLPNRALTIDEVRALINHGVKPNTDEKPPEPSKPLNDPLYTPDAAPAPLRAQPADNHLTDENDILPPPGTVANPPATPAPEDSEPLPQ